MGEPLDLTSLSIGAIVNVASGGTDDSTVKRVEEILADAGHSARLWSVTGTELDAALMESKDLDVLIVVGGDGTIRSAAEASTIDGPALIPLPGGTMNLLPKALYGSMNWEEALAATLANPVVRTISGGKVGDTRFFIAAILGAPVLWAGAREALREGDVIEAAAEGAHALKHMFASKIHYQFNELHEGNAEVVWITCPLIASTLEDDRKVLEAAVIDAPGAGELLEIATAAALGQWRDARNVAVVTTKKVEITSETDIPLILDGELERGGKQVAVEFVPQAFRAVVPYV